MQGRSKAPLWKLIPWIEATALVGAPAAAESAGAKAISELKKTTNDPSNDPSNED
jgi:hypothetical protein